MNILTLVHMATFNNYLSEDTFGEDIKILYLKGTPYILENSSYLHRITTVRPKRIQPKI